MNSRTLSIREALEAHEPTDALEARHLAAMRALCGSEGDVTSRHHYDPGHFTASAFVLHPTRPALLLIHHGKLDRWLQPGGHIDPEDTDIVAAALREVHEETGLELTRGHVRGLLDVDVHRIPPLGPHPSHEHFDVRFLMASPTDRIAHGSDAKAARWVELDAVHEAESDASVMRAVAKLAR